jgi:hypothetical protein
MGEKAISKYLTFLADKANVSASTQNQAFCSVLFLYRDVLEINLSKIDHIHRRSIRMCLTKAEEG